MKISNFIIILRVEERNLKMNPSPYFLLFYMIDFVLDFMIKFWMELFEKRDKESKNIKGRQ